MEMTGIKPCIISVGIGNWYPVGVDRLERSLSFHGYAGDFIGWKNDYPPGSPSHEDNPYAFKIWAFNEAISRGYKIILYLDSSFWAIANPGQIFDIINDDGVFCFRTGYNCAQTCTDRLLNYCNITRDEAEYIPESAGGAIGFNIENPAGRNVFENWTKMAEFGLFKSSRNYDPNDSMDSRFIHSRQDQSAFSLACHQAGVNKFYPDYVMYYDGRQKYPDNTKFLIGGIQ